MSPNFSILDHYRQMARYNTEANRILYHACAALDDAALKQARPAFFGTIHGTLNHILVGDRLWMARFRGEAVPALALDAVLHEAFDDLRAARVSFDAEIEAFMTGLKPEFLGSVLHYENYQGKVCDDPVPLCLAHFFNHQTHHRGQVHDLLTQTEVPPPSLDLHRVLIPI
ncbi:MAG: DinB family protein [Alphaproteobacteria bacterium]|nr:DinB family protein [Alphaproteobacteria bacterium]